MIEKINIERFLESGKQHPVLDVRSPGEFTHAHIPGAISFPLFTDEERKVVGTAYKQQGREIAIKIGLDYFGPKMRAMVEQAELIIKEHGEKENRSNIDHGSSKTILVHCWRGGMRSAAIAWLLDLYGFKVYTLSGGYKKFRGFVLDVFKHPFSFNILGGYTGSGKTELLKGLKAADANIIDLEDLAKHKGSAFGNIGMPVQPTQEMFENILALEMNPYKSNEQPVWLEDESQRIGLVNIPNDLWKTMRQSPVYFLEIPFEERLKHITEEYGSLDRQRMIDAITRIREKLGGQNAKLAISFLEEGNTIESFRILLHYYDKFYTKALHNRTGLNDLLKTVPCEKVSVENAAAVLTVSGSKATGSPL